MWSASDLWQQLEFASELISDLRDTVDRGREWLVDFNAGITQLVSFDQKILTRKWIGLDWDFYIISIAKTASKKIKLKFMKVYEVSFSWGCPYLYNSTIQPCMEYFCNVWASARICYLELLDKLQKWICRTTGPWLAASLEPLAHRQNVANLSLFNRY